MKEKVTCIIDNVSTELLSSIIRRQSTDCSPHYPQVNIRLSTLTRHFMQWRHGGGSKKAYISIYIHVYICMCIYTQFWMDIWQISAKCFGARGRSCGSLRAPMSLGDFRVDDRCCKKRTGYALSRNCIVVPASQCRQATNTPAMMA